jgi:acetyl-CoA/propionyl-CoA carboxylase biotin carboxyl carrier protein
MGAVAPAAVAKPRARRSSAGGSGGRAADGTVVAPMQGTILKVMVGEGDEVQADQTVVVLEAMKMENNVATPKAGTVKELKVAAGDTVGTGDVIVVIE